MHGTRCPRRRDRYVLKDVAVAQDGCRPDRCRNDRARWCCNGLARRRRNGLARLRNTRLVEGWFNLISGNAFGPRRGHDLSRIWIPSKTPNRARRLALRFDRARRLFDMAMGQTASALQFPLQRAKVELLQLACVGVFFEQQQHALSGARILSARFQHPATELRKRAAASRQRIKPVQEPRRAQRCGEVGRTLAQYDHLL